MRARTLRIGLVALLLAGCAPATASSGSGAGDTLTREELSATGVGSLYDAIDRLRPRWLTVRSQRSLGQLSTEVVVYQNQTYLGGVDVLRQFDADMPVRVRYLDGATASASLPGLGSRHVEGAIVIETAAGSP